MKIRSISASLAVAACVFSLSAQSKLDDTTGRQPFVDRTLLLDPPAAAFHQKDIEFEPKPYESSAEHDSRQRLQTNAIGDGLGTQIYGISSWVNPGELRQLLYKTPSFYRSGYIYTAVLEPISGDPDLYLHERVNGTWRMLKRSWNGGTALDSFSFTRADLTSTATNVDLDAKGYTAATFHFYLYEKAVSSGFLQFPLRYNSWTPYTAVISAVVDHSMPTGGNCADNKVVTYTNEVGLAQYGVSPYWSTVNPGGCGTRLYAFKNASGTPFNVNGQLKPDSQPYIFYDGHTGYDYPVPDGTAVYPAASGTAYLYPDGIQINHPNGYSTYYLHLSARYITDGQSVTPNTTIGATGQAHLHFTVKKGSERADPYGWKGPAGQDPLKVGGQDNVCLWLTCQ
ncbi:MAG: hypothetical protein QOJ98_3402 [Acidobacteriota bacterium]|nr:hypothetical protein [Acidobacteriota bacterium]